MKKQDLNLSTNTIADALLEEAIIDDKASNDILDLSNKSSKEDFYQDEYKFRSRYNYRGRRPYRNRKNRYNRYNEYTDFSFKIIQNIKTLSKQSSGWSKELNIVQFKNYPPRLDIRDWNENHSKMSKGIGFTIDETIKLKEALATLDQDSLNDLIK